MSISGIERENGEAIWAQAREDLAKAEDILDEQTFQAAVYREIGLRKALKKHNLVHRVLVDLEAEAGLRGQIDAGKRRDPLAGVDRTIFDRG